MCHTLSEQQNIKISSFILTWIDEGHVNYKTLGIW